MPNRISLAFTFWLTSTLALLAPVPTAPERTTECITVSSHPGSQLRELAIFSGQPTSRVSAALPTDTVLEVNDLASENEEQDRADALDEPRVTFLIPRSFHNDHDRQLIVPRSILSLYPLRC